MVECGEGAHCRSCLPTYFVIILGIRPICISNHKAPLMRSAATSAKIQIVVIVAMITRIRV